MTSKTQSIENALHTGTLVESVPLIIVGIYFEIYWSTL
jgi:hypothetical protein